MHFEDGSWMAWHFEVVLSGYGIAFICKVVSNA